VPGRPGTPSREHAGTDRRRLELAIGSEVRKGRVTVGRLERLVVDPTTGRVTHLVVGHDGRAVLVPVSWVECDQDEIVQLSPEAGDLDQLPTFDPAEYLEAGPDHPTLAGGRSPGDVVFSLGGSLWEIRSQTRASEGVTAEQPGRPGVQISNKTEVLALDRPAGRVRYVVLDHATGTVSHVVVRLRLGLLARRDVVVPLAWATRITSDCIELAVRRDELAALPEFHLDEEIVDEIRARLHDDPRFQGVDFYGIDVQVDGGVARLRGHVRRADLKQVAEEIAAAVPGVLSVENEVVADDELADRVEHALRADARLEREDLEVVALLGMVELRGRVATPEQREAAAETAGRVSGVENVVNKLEVAQPAVGSAPATVAEPRD
jgi:osmotically-inducible protein OsmY/sporulation protein YlmC with PRC-barrel domain